MSLFKFEDFIFDSANYHLTQNGSRISIRPKTAQLLSFLLRNRNRVVSKAEIMAAVWDSDNVRDYALFQLISELRKLSKDRELVRTQPNAGYQWIAYTKTVKRGRGFPLYATAGFFIAVIGVAIAASMPINSTQEEAAKISRLPAVNAFTKGVLALEKGENERAIEWFEFSLSENPESVEASLFLAETLFLQQNLEASASQLQALLQRPDLNAYHAMTASDLMSRIRQQQGQLHEALVYAEASAKANVSAHCSVDVVEQRVEVLKGILGQKHEMSPITETEGSSKALSERKDSDRCARLKTPVDDSSACLQTPYTHYAFAQLNESDLMIRNRTV